MSPLASWAMRTLNRLLVGLLVAFAAASAIGDIREGRDLWAGLMIAATLMLASQFVDQPEREAS